MTSAFQKELEEHLPNDVARYITQPFFGVTEDEVKENHKRLMMELLSLDESHTTVRQRLRFYYNDRLEGKFYKKAEEAQWDPDEYDFTRMIRHARIRTGNAEESAKALAEDAEAERQSEEMQARYRYVAKLGARHEFTFMQRVKKLAFEWLLPTSYRDTDLGAWLLFGSNCIKVNLKKKDVAWYGVVLYNL